MKRATPRLIYVIGDARSGSTILDAVLGSQPGIVATGELHQLLLDDFGEPRLCACGSTMQECLLWGPVLDRWSRGLAPGVPADYLRLQEWYERFRHLPRLVMDSRRRSLSFETYARWTADLLAAIGEAGSVDTIADSSKNPLRGWALLKGGAFEMALIHGVRDPRGVVWSKLKLLRWRGLPSWLRSPVAVVLRAAFDWMVVNLSTELILGQYKDVPQVRIRYEDFADDPREALHRVGSTLHLDLESLADRAAKGEIFTFSHIMAGNVARREAPRALIKDDDWRTAAPAWVRRTVWAVCGGWARRYGYKRE